MGFDGFALNTKEPNEWWATEAIDQLFAAAEGTGFKLFFSLDMNGHSDNSIFTSLFDGYFDQEAYLKVGDEQKPFVSTFWGGQLGQEAWSGMVNDYNLHFVPSFDDLDGYYEDPASFFEKWGDIVDGAFNWETAWPGGSGKPANVSSDDDADWHDAATDVQKDFMMREYLQPQNETLCANSSKPFLPSSTSTAVAPTPTVLERATSLRG